jgi:molybdate transport system substrate-binding protein
MAAPAPSLRIFAAGSLRAALTEIVTGAAANRVDLVFGPAGLLRERIEGGEPADAFLSANLAHPEALAAASPDAAPRIFARNAFVALARRELGLTAENFLDRLLAGDVRIGTSTPGADPSGDYARQLFARADAIRPGAGALLAARALHLVGGRDHVAAATSVHPARGFLASAAVDVFLSYHSGALPLVGEFDLVHPPRELAITAEYALIALAREPERRAHAERMVAEVLSTRGQDILARHGFMRAI